MNAQRYLTVGLVCVWASVLVIPWGMYQATLSPQFPAFERKFESEWAARDAPRMVMPATAAWIFMIPFALFIGLLYTGGVLIVPWLTLWRRDVGRLAAIAFGLGCLLGATLGLGEMANSFRWGFIAQGLGAFLAAAGLMLGAAGLAIRCRWDRQVRVNP